MKREGGNFSFAEAESIMSTLYSQDTAIDNLIYNSEERGLKRGIKQEKINSARVFIQRGLTNFEDIKASGIYTAEELAAIAAQ